MAISTIDNVLQKIGKGEGFSMINLQLSSGTTTTAAAAASGFITTQLHFNGIGTARPSTLVGLPLPPVLPNSLNFVFGQAGLNSSNRGMYLAWIYKIGTLNLAATGNQFTHDAATFPILRTQFGVASQALTLIPILMITVATTTTAAILRLRNNSGPAAGYNNQDGTGTIGTIDFTLPNVATTVDSGFILRLEDGDSGVQNITQIDITTAAAVGTADVWGAELICPFGEILPLPFTMDAMTGGLSMADFAPGVATSGTATAYLVVVGIGSVTTITGLTFVQGVLNTA